MCGEEAGDQDRGRFVCMTRRQVLTEKPQRGTGFGEREMGYTSLKRRKFVLTQATLAHLPPGLTVSIGRVVIEDATSSPVVASQNDEVALVVRGAAEAAVATGSEAAILDRAGAQVTVQYPGVHQHDGHVALRQVCLDVLHTHCAVGQEGGWPVPLGPCPHLCTHPQW